MNETISTEAVTTGKDGRRSVRLTTLLVWGAIILVLGVLGWGLLNTNAPRPEPGQAAPPFAMEFFDGYEWEGLATAGLEDMAGRPVILNFWASWCVECRLEADMLENSWRKYRDDGVVFVGIAYVDSEPKSRAYLEEFNITYPNAPDLGSDISDRYEITGVPETFFIDQNGQVTAFKFGPLTSQAELDGYIEGMLAGS